MFKLALDLRRKEVRFQSDPSLVSRHVETSEQFKFTTYLCATLAEQMQNAADTLLAVAMNGIKAGYDYPAPVKFVVSSPGGWS